VPADISPIEAAEAGMQSIEHMRAELGGYCTRATETACAPVIAAFRAHGTWQVPTLAVRRARAYLDEPTRATDPRLADEPRALREQWLDARRRRLARRTEADFRTMRGEFAEEQWLAGHLHRSGVRLLAGSDAGADFSYHGSGLHDELRELVAAGLSPLEAVQAATIRAATFLGRQGRTGEVRAGADADLVLLEDNPLADIGAVSRIRGVMTRGAWLPRADLDRVLVAAREAAR
jgi:imidazolonepropionase-like amidohydrolase